MKGILDPSNSFHKTDLGVKPLYSGGEQREKESVLKTIKPDFDYQLPENNVIVPGTKRLDV